MITLAAIWRYPVKSLCGARVEEATIDERGIVGDRRFMVVDAGGRFVTQRERPELARLVPRLAGGRLAIEAPGGARVEVATAGPGEPRTVTIWGDAVAAEDAGDAAAAFLAEHLGGPYRLARLPDSTRRPADRDDARPGDLVAFQDGFPFLLVNEASLTALAARLDQPIDARRFRPNLVVAGPPAWAEDAWTELRIGPLTLHVRKACSRCSVVDVDPDRGERGSGVLAELGRFRKVGRAALFGQNLVHDGAGVIREGDEVVLVSVSP